MAVKVFLDANIILDFLLKREGFAEARKILELAVDNYIKAYITPSVVNLAGHWVSKKHGSSKSKEMLLSLLADVSTIDIQQEIVLLALHSTINDIEDAIQYYTALHHKMDYFITRDKKLLKEGIPALPIILPKDFLETI